jgi:hypothetical protein
MLQSSTWGSQFSSGDFLSTQASRHTAKIANFPRPIPHLPQPAGKVGSRLSGGKLPGVRQETVQVVARRFRTSSDHLDRVDTAGHAGDLRRPEKLSLVRLFRRKRPEKPVLVSAEPPDEVAAARVVNG